MDDLEVENLFAARSLVWVYLKKKFNQVVQIAGVVVWNFFVGTREHRFEQLVHCLRAERRIKGRHLVDDAAKRPNIALVVVGLIFPDLGTRVVGRPSLSH